MGKTLSRLGGTKRKQQLHKWKDGPNSVWSLTVNAQEVCKQMAKRKLQVEQQLQQEVSKRRKLEDGIKGLKEEVKTLRKDARALSRLRMGLADGTRGSSSKHWQSYSRQHKSIKKKRLASQIKTALSSCSEHFQPMSVEVWNKDTGDKEHLDLASGTFSPSSSSMDPDNKVKFTLYVKDKFCLSDEAYRELSLITKDLPRMCRLKKVLKELNSHQTVSPAPGNILGMQQSLKDRLLVRLHYVSQCGRRSELLHNNRIRVKLSGDGTRVGRNLHLVNFTFTLIDEPQAMSVAGNYTIAVFEMSEHYDELDLGLHDIAKEVDELNTIVLNGTSLELEFFLGGDWKFLALICGLKAANADYSCIWCKCHTDDRWNMDLEWSLVDTSKGARTINEINEMSKKPSKSSFGCANSPIFESIPIDHVVIDTLHLFLRIGDLLINLLIMDLRRQDGIEKTKVNKLDRTKLTHLATYEKFLNEQCKISFQWYVDDSKLKWRDLTGGEKLRLFNTIDIPDLFPTLPNKEKIKALWSKFIELIGWLKTNELPEEGLDCALKQWVRDFCFLYQTKHVTPYVHALAMHVPEMVRRYGNLSKFTQQGLEKLNDVTTKHYLRATNHRKEEAIQQLIEKRNRLEELENCGCVRTKRPCKCSACGQIGHNKRTCLSVMHENRQSVQPTPLADISLN